MSHPDLRGLARSLATVAALALLVSGTAVSTGASAVAAARDANRAPGAPQHLTVDDRREPLAVEGTPQFGWLPQDQDGNEVQTAYELRVSRGSQVVWDSG